MIEKMILGNAIISMSHHPPTPFQGGLYAGGVLVLILEKRPLNALLLPKDAPEAVKPYKFLFDFPPLALTFGFW
ncbi:hypothetical protein EFA69_17645 [Rufibacter immobilis]|uniref:Uncharacterized protein n=2 Tax=Rufibacter immobilis TaxID=1348778 RepID=A0A3M9MQT8_9BACT|nr:hypothetical protein EFA69_17645 [Rufibacter immobilis]